MIGLYLPCSDTLVVQVLIEVQGRVVPVGDIGAFGRLLEFGAHHLGYMV